MIKPSSSFNYIFNYGLEFLKSNSIENPKKEIEIFLCQLLSCSKFELYNREEKSISLIKVNLLKEWLDRRAKREPIQYIINNAWFYGREFYVNKNVFIPRPESERLIEEATNHLKDFDSPKILEIGTGSGCLSISLAIEFPNSDVQSIDISENPLFSAYFSVFLRAFPRTKNGIFLSSLSASFNQIILFSVVLSAASTTCGSFFCPGLCAA